MKNPNANASVSSTRGEISAVFFLLFFFPLYARYVLSKGEVSEAGEGGATSHCDGSRSCKCNPALHLTAGCACEASPPTPTGPALLQSSNSRLHFAMFRFVDLQILYVTLFTLLTSATLVCVFPVFHLAGPPCCDCASSVITLWAALPCANNWP